MKKFTKSLLAMCVIFTLATACVDGEKGDPNVDYDLTSTNITMAFSTMADMAVNPSTYFGKSVKAKGKYVPLYVEESDNSYHLLAVWDSTVCCMRYMSFERSDGATDYPEADAEIEITGILRPYGELNFDLMSASYLEVSDVTVVQ